MKNKLYYLSRKDGAAWDEIIDMVLVAASVEQAKGYSLEFGKTWASYENIKVEYIGDTHLPLGYLVMTATLHG